MQPILNVPALVWLTAKGTVDAPTAVAVVTILLHSLAQGIATGGGRGVAAELRAAVDAAPGASYVPGRLEFHTTNSSGNILSGCGLRQTAILVSVQVPRRLYAFDFRKNVSGTATFGLTNTDTKASDGLSLFNSATSGGVIQRSTGHATEASDSVIPPAANKYPFLHVRGFRR
jgi:hypothetical protein